MIRQKYTPPTCTLEIMAQASPLSRWAGRPVLKNVEFTLHFDAPQLPEEQRVTVRGNQAQLQELCEVVRSYVQQLLQQSPAHLDAVWLTNNQQYDNRTSFPKQASSSERGRGEAEAEVEFFNGEPMETSRGALLPPSRISPPQPPEADEGLDSLEPALSVPTVVVTGETRGGGIYLQAQGLLCHDLYLGSLGTEESGGVVCLGLLELFDLASALEEYSGQSLPLPALKKTLWVTKPPEWARTAAVVLLTVGVTATTLKLLEGKPASQTGKPGESALQVPANPGPQILANSPAPLLPPPSPPPSAPPLPNQNLATQNLPKLPPMGGTASPPVTQVPISPGSPSPGGPVSGGSVSGGSVSGGPVSGGPVSGGPVPNATIQIPPPPNNVMPAIPNPPGQVLPNVTTLPGATLPPSGAASPLPAGNTPAPTRTSAPPNVALTPNVPPTTAPQAGSREPGAAPPAAKSPASPAAASSSGLGNGELPPQLPSVDLPDSLSGDKQPASPDASVAATPVPQPEAKDNQPAQPPADPREFNLQVEEARDYFQQRWNPPSGLNQTVEYTLSLNGDGSIREILPRGITAERLLDRTGMPLRNEPFVSPVRQGEAPRIRVVLMPDGKVKTFEEPYKDGF